jgi:outer membrane protein TolC
LLVAREFFTYTERGGLAPSLNLSATYTRSINPGPFARENQTTLGATLSFPLWDSGITRARVRAAREDEVQTKLALEQVRLGVALGVKSAVVRLRNAAVQVNFAKKIVEQQTEALRLAELRYNSGEGILIDVTSADADLRQALGGLVNARAEYLTAYAALQQAIGLDALPQPATTNTQGENQ